ncbi:hypothetical protein EJ05DRAFT_486266 [Pseudovirgaria hyperparasitica]|uniref:UDENN FLCN/SMCR8-type domain-containing protein n=1 Tax=Pseudovirgaria hyperparasitica TaxID=470096 RepID=A0A6A6W8J8_9PEZI|nr:uncharacterized protein EJ05DRAFT_486266 [Pseudovirgaria hyperparasitica]KAF2758216.1 hypothetical protein EJ05DRAFT_486266 [Pseudovirgaria hyperparasitica]
MDFILSLAHFCEICGPTSTICTQIVPGNCATCHPCLTPPSEEPSQSSYSTNPTWTDTSASSPTTRLAHRMSGVASPFESPPLSPRTPSSSFNNPYFPATIDGFAVTRFTENLGSDGDGCDNCDFLVPEHVRARLPEGAPGSPTKDGRGRNGSPVLRSCQSVLARGPSPDSDEDDDDDDDDDDDEQSKSYLSNSSSSPSSVTSSTPTSPLSLPRNTHAHKLIYMSTRQPISPSAYSLLRRSYVRTFSCEALPKNSRSGPLFFGDCSSGYTIAYVFRLPDPRARGRLRTYALIALGGRDSRRVSSALVKVLEHFESIANQIITMADRVLERDSPVSRPTTAIQQPPPTSPLLSNSSSSSSSSSTSSASLMPAVPQQTPESGNRVSNTGSKTAPIDPYPAFASPPPHADSARRFTPASSFLSAKKVDPDGYPRVSREVMRAKGLADIVGNQNFFVELHAKFTVLLSSLINDFGTGVAA